jgi:hypothetical protein
MSLTAQRTFVLPKYEKDELFETLSQYEGVERDLIHSEVWALEVVQKLKEAAVSAESLAWLSIWQKIYECVRAALAGMREESSFTLAAANRSIGELMMSVSVIAEPLTTAVNEAKGTSVELGSTKMPWKQVKRRLRAFCGWCIANDLNRHTNLLDKKVLADIFDPEPARKIIRGDPKSLAVHIALSGGIEELSDSEAENDRNRFEKGVLTQKRQLEKLVEEFDLMDWVARADRADTFFSLLDELQTSIPKRLRAIGMSFSYPSFIRTSQVIHGSSLDLSIGLTTTVAYPQPPYDQRDGELDAKQVASLAKHALILMSMMAEHCLPKQPT